MTHGSVCIRAATAEDAPRIVEYNSRLAEESEGRRIAVEVLRAGVARALASPALCRYWIAERGGTPVGQTMVTFELTDWRDGLLWWIQSVYVVPEARGGGVFAALFRHIEAEARASGDARGLRLYVHEDNTRAMEIYAHLGMPPGSYRVCERDWSRALGPSGTNR